MTNETRNELLAEIEGQAADTPATEYTPPEGWRLLAVGDRLQSGDMWVNYKGESRPTKRVGETVHDEQYIRLIEPEPQPQPEEQPQPEPVQVREGRWRTRHGDIRNVTPTPADDSRATRWPWRDAKYDQTWREDGGCHIIGESPSDLVEYLGPIEQQPKPEPQPEPHPDPDAELQIRLLKEANDSQAETIGRLQAAIDERAELGGVDQTRAELQARIRGLEAIRDTQAATIEELRSEVSYVQNLLGESRQRVTQLEELVASLRTINEASEKAFEAANKQNDAFRVQIRILQQQASKKASRIDFLETLNAGNGAAIGEYVAKIAKLQGLVDTARGQLETAATEHDSLSTQLAAVKAELVTQAEISRRLQIELDAAQQVPADSPELRQLRADLEQMTLGRDTYRDGYNRVLSDLETARETAKAETVETIAEWTEPFRTCGSQGLSYHVMQNLPHIMRTLTGLTPED